MADGDHWSLLLVQGNRENNASFVSKDKNIRYMDPLSISKVSLSIDQLYKVCDMCAQISVNICRVYVQNLFVNAKVITYLKILHTLVPSCVT